MRLVFAGTPQFAAPILDAVAQRHVVLAVLTQPDRPRGRSLRPEASQVKIAATKLNIPVLQPERLQGSAVVDQLTSLTPEAIIVAAYGHILPAELLSLPPQGCINIHPSLLPAYRGPAPVTQVIMNGETRTGVSIMRLDEGMDTGPVFAQSPVAIGPDETAGELSERLADEGADLLLRVLEEIQAGTAVATPQPREGVSITTKVTKEQGRIDWKATARQIHNMVRALNPAPGAFTSLAGRRLKVYRTAIASGEGTGLPGEIVGTEGELRVVAGAGVVKLIEVQPENKGRMSGDAFARGYRPVLGDRLGET